MDNPLRQSLDAYLTALKASYHPRTVRYQRIVIAKFLNWSDRNRSDGNSATSAQGAGPATASIGSDLQSPVRSRQASLRIAGLAIFTYTGLRFSELRHLRIEDIDLVGNWLTVAGGTGSKYCQARRVPIHHQLRNILSSILSEPLANSESQQSPETPWSAVTSHGAMFKAESAHTNRRTFLALAVEAGVPPHIIESWMGNSPRPNDYVEVPDEQSQSWMQKIPF